MAVGRNDPCPCGSGKKYKKCCLPKQEVISLAAVRETQAHERLLEQLLDYIKDQPDGSEVDYAFDLFYSEQVPADDDEPEPDAALEQFQWALPWVAFGYRSEADGATFAQRFAAQASGLSPLEREILAGWEAGAPGYFQVQSVSAQAAQLTRIPDGRPFTLLFSGSGLRAGDLVAIWLLPGPSGFRPAYNVQAVPVDLEKPLRHLLEVELALLHFQEPGATWDDLYRGYWPRLAECGLLAAEYEERVLWVQPPPGARRARDSAPEPGTQHLVAASAEAGTSGAKAEAVAGLLRQVLAAEWAGSGQIAAVLRLWWDAFRTLQPRIVRPEAWAAAVFYLFINVLLERPLTQAEAGEYFGVSASSVGKRSREIDDALELEPMDFRYLDLLDPMFRMAWRAYCQSVCKEGPTILTQPPAGLGSLPDSGPRLVRSTGSGAMRGTEPALRQLAWELSGEERDPARIEAEELLDQAWEATGRRRLQLAQRALETWPDAVDGYVILAQEAAGQGHLAEACRLYRQGVAAGERLLGPDYFRENVGHFWGLIETRPYMRARAGLADALWATGEREAAVDHYRDLLRLNPNDNQGIRYLLAARLLELGHDQELEALLQWYKDDNSAAFRYTRALCSYRRHGPGRQADQALKQALRQNPYVPAYLTGEQRLPARLPEFVGWGDRTEAQAYASEFAQGWRETPGALDWLRSHRR